MNSKNKATLKKVMDQIDEMENCTTTEDAVNRLKTMYDQIERIYLELSATFRQQSMRSKFDGDLMEDINYLNDAMELIKSLIKRVGRCKRYSHKRIFPVLDEITTKIYTLVLE